MPRAIWSGAIQFGLVNVPVRMYSAIEEQTLHFNLLHEPDDGRIGYEKICKDEGKPVPDDEIVKAFEVEKGQYVVVRDEDFEAAAAEVENYHVIEIRDFVPYEEIDPIFFERTYYLAPAEGAERIYALLLEAMEDSELAALATFVMRERQHLACLRVREGVITLERMHFADEIRPVDEIQPERPKVDRKELDLARRLMESYTGSFEPEKYEDVYRNALLEIIRANAKGKEIHRPEPEEPESPPDLMEALRRSIEASKTRGRAGGGDGDRLERLTKDELYELAKQAEISGRSQMGREELIEALREAA